MPRKSPQSNRKYVLRSKEQGFSDEFGVDQVRLHFTDKYDGWHHKGSRFFARQYTAALNRYLAKRPHLDHKHKKNWARKISFIPYGFRSWSKFMPGGFATYYVYEPHHKKMVDGKRLDPITNRLFRHGIEGVGMRTRAYILSWIIEDWVKSRSEPLRWVSLGGGSGQPLYDALRLMEVSLRERSELTLVDSDRKVVEFAKSLHDLQKTELPTGRFLHDDIFRPELFKEIHDGGLIDGIDIMGIFEYLNDEQSIELLKRCYENLSPGGVLVFSNMDSDRPDYDINQRVIGWPELRLRSVMETMDLLDAAGLPREDITYLQARDAINNVYRVKKS